MLDKSQGKKRRKKQKASNVTPRHNAPRAASSKVLTTKSRGRHTSAGPPPAVSPPRDRASSANPGLASVTKSSLKKAVVNWILSKLQKPSRTRPAKQRPANERLKLWMVGTLHWTALIAVIGVAVFCMFALLDPQISLKIKAGIVGLLGYIIRKFVLYLTRIEL